MNRALRMFAGLLIVLGGFAPAWAQQAGLLPVPVLQNVQVRAEAAFDSGTRFYTFRYAFTNPVGNTGEIASIYIDVSGGVRIVGTGLTLPLGGRNVPFDDFVALFTQPDRVPTVTFGLQVPSGWMGGMGARGFAAFASGDPQTRSLGSPIRTETRLRSP